jgi:hypothetical protein
MNLFNGPLIIREEEEEEVNFDLFFFHSFQMQQTFLYLSCLYRLSCKSDIFESRTKK